MPQRPPDPDSDGTPPLAISDERLALLHDAFDAAFGKLIPDGEAYARRFVDRGSAQDVVQAALQWLWKTWRAAGEPPAESQQKLFWRVLRWRIANHRRRSSAEERAIEGLRARTPTEEQAVRPAEDEESSDLQRIAARIPALLEELPVHYREAYQLMAEQGLTDAQAEEKTGVNRSTMRWRLMRARERIAVKLAAEGFDLSVKPTGKGAKEVTST